MLRQSQRRTHLALNAYHPADMKWEEGTQLRDLPMSDIVNRIDYTCRTRLHRLAGGSALSGRADTRDDRDAADDRHRARATRGTRSSPSATAPTGSSIAMVVTVVALRCCSASSSGGEREQGAEHDDPGQHRPQRCTAWSDSRPSRETSAPSRELAPVTGATTLRTTAATANDQHDHPQRVEGVDPDLADQEVRREADSGARGRRRRRCRRSGARSRCPSPQRGRPSPTRARATCCGRTCSCCTNRAQRATRIGARYSSSSAMPDRQSLDGDEVGPLQQRRRRPARARRPGTARRRSGERRALRSEQGGDEHEDHQRAGDPDRGQRARVDPGPECDPADAGVEHEEPGADEHQHEAVGRVALHLEGHGQSRP